MSQSRWLVAALVPGLERHPLKRLAVGEAGPLRQRERWREEAGKAGRGVARMAVAVAAGRDGFWLARWPRARCVEAPVIHPTSVAVSREHRRAKTDRLDTEPLKRAFLGWRRGGPNHCGMAAIPSLAEEDARRPNREREARVAERTRVINRIRGCLARLGIRAFKPPSRRAPERLEGPRTPERDALPPNTLSEPRRAMARLRRIRDQSNEVESARSERLDASPATRQNAMAQLLARVTAVGVEPADILVHEIPSRGLRDRRAVARYAGRTGAIGKHVTWNAPCKFSARLEIAPGPMPHIGQKLTTSIAAQPVRDAAPMQPLANARPNLRPERRMLSCVTLIPRSEGSGSRGRSRRLSSSHQPGPAIPFRRGTMNVTIPPSRLSLAMLESSAESVLKPSATGSWCGSTSAVSATRGAPISIPRQATGSSIQTGTMVTTPGATSI